MRTTIRLGLLGLLLFAAFVYLNNSALIAEPPAGKPTLLAHRGLHQTFASDGLQADTCTAARIRPPEHPYLENTLPAIEAAFRLGADVVELDVHPTTDGQFAVFHDWTLGCRTDSLGVTRERSLAELKALDIGYGYTADNGATHPFRGRGIGLLPSLDDVLAAFPDKRLLIHIKSNDPDEGDKLAQRLRRLAPGAQQRLMVYGGARPVEIVRQQLGLRTMSAAWEKRCLLRYLAVGWSGYVPDDCRHGLLLVPANYAPWLWGWPGKFIERMRRAGTEVFVLGPVGSGEEFSRGIDSEADFRVLPAQFSGGIWTNRIDRIAPLARPAGNGS